MKDNLYINKDRLLLRNSGSVDIEFNPVYTNLFEVHFSVIGIDDTSVLTGLVSRLCYDEITKCISIAFNVNLVSEVIPPANLVISEVIQPVKLLEEIRSKALRFDTTLKILNRQGEFVHETAFINCSIESMTGMQEWDYSADQNDTKELLAKIRYENIRYGVKR